MSATRTLARAGLIVTSAFLVSRILGYVRVVVIGTTFGADSELDTFFAAFRIPDLIFQLVAAGAVSSALIPVVSSLLAGDERARAWRVVSTVANLMLVGLAVLAVLVFVWAPLIVPAITPGFSQDQIARTVELTRTMLLSPIFLALGAIATSVLNSEGRFAASAAAPITYNLAIIAAALFLAPSMGVEGLAVGVVLGSVAHLAIQLRPLARLGFRYQPRVDVADGEATHALALMAPRAIGLGASQITFVAMTYFASALAVGSLSAFNFAMTLLQIPLGVIGVPLGIVILPTLSRDLATGAVERFLGLVNRALRLLAFVMLPTAALGIVLRREVVSVLFEHGAFTAEAVDLTAEALLFFLFGLAAHSFIAVLARAFYAGRDTVTPVAAAIVAVVVNVGFAAATVGSFGLAALSLAIAVGAWVETAILVVALRRRYAALDLASVGWSFGRSLVAATVAALLALATRTLVEPVVGPSPGTLGTALVLVLGSLVGGVGYLAMSLLLRSPELPALISLTNDLIRRPRTP